ncbi:MAG: hypothetical protein KDA22_09830 [Phycisphaerales bacterium]|nr:hypothetical protein [Phycisphaerales bacterium]
MKSTRHGGETRLVPRSGCISCPRGIGLVRMLLALLLLGAATAPLASCAGPARTGPQATQRFGPGSVTAETVNAKLLGFADDHVLRVIEATDAVSAQCTDVDQRSVVNALSLRNAQATFAIATSPNPIAGLTDMVVMVSLTKEAIRRRAIDRTLSEAQRLQPESYRVSPEALDGMFSPEDRILYRAISDSDRDVRALAESVFWPEQIAQLDRLLEEWWERNPDRRLVSQVRLQDFARYRGATMEAISLGPRNIFALLYLDPFASMDPSAREIAQSRMLAERVTYQLNRLPLLISMHARGLLYESLTTKEVVSLRTTLEEAGQTMTRLADVADRWPEDVAAEREAALSQIRTGIAEERERTLAELADAVGSERSAAIADIEAAVGRQRDELLTAIDVRTGAVQDSLSRLDDALVNAESLSSSVRDTAHSIDNMDVENFQALVASATDGVKSLERSLATIERLLAPENVDRVFGGSGGGKDMLHSATASSRDVVDHLFWRGVQLAVVVLALWILAVVVVRLIGNWIPSKRP